MVKIDPRSPLKNVQWFLFRESLYWKTTSFVRQIFVRFQGDLSKEGQLYLKEEKKEIKRGDRRKKGEKKKGREDMKDKKGYWKKRGKERRGGRKDGRREVGERE